LKAAPHYSSKKPAKDDLVDLTTDKSKSAVPHLTRPIGNKKSKRREEEEKIISNVTEAICGSITTVDGNGSTAAVVGAALGQFTSLILEALPSWQHHPSYTNADPALKKRYNNLLLMKRIHELEQTAVTTGTNNDATLVTPFNSTTPSINDAPGSVTTEHTMEHLGSTTIVNPDVHAAASMLSNQFHSGTNTAAAVSTSRDDSIGDESSISSTTGSNDNTNDPYNSRHHDLTRPGIVITKRAAIHNHARSHSIRKRALPLAMQRRTWVAPQQERIEESQKIVYEERYEESLPV